MHDGYLVGSEVYKIATVFIDCSHLFICLAHLLVQCTYWPISQMIKLGTGNIKAVNIAHHIDVVWSPEPPPPGSL